MALTNGVTTTCTTTTVTTTVTTTTTTTTTIPVTLPYTTPATTPATTPPTTQPTTPATTPPTTQPTTQPTTPPITPPTTPATTPATTPITTAAATSSPATPNVIPDGDFSSGLGPWTPINGNPAGWINPNVNNNNSPDGKSPNFQVTNTQNSGQFFLSSPSFALQASSTYTWTFFASNSAGGSSWLSHLAAQINCGSYSVATAVTTMATPGPNGYLISSTTFNTPTSTDSQVLQQLGYCQAQILFQPGVTPTNNWFLADVAVSYVGPMAPAPPVTSAAP